MLKVAELEKLYAEMSDEKFASIRREELVEAAWPYYDREARRRGLPEAVSQPLTQIPPCDTETEAEMLEISTPEAKQILREADTRRDARRREVERLRYIASLRSNTGPWNLPFTYRRTVIPAKYRGDNLIVWLRRFHVKRRGGLRFNNLLVNACQGLGFPLTVRDTTFRSSDDEVIPRFIPYLFLWSAGLTVAMALGNSFIGGIVLLVGVPLFLFMILAGERFGYNYLEDPIRGRAKTLHLIQEIRERRGKHGDGSVLILRCQDHFWRDIVQLCLKNASAVVIDVTEISENVIWELETALHLMAPQSIILACGLGAGDAEMLPGDAQVVLAAESGPESNRVQQFFYPRHEDQVDFKRFGTIESLWENLRARLAIAVAYSRDRQNQSSDSNS